MTLTVKRAVPHDQRAAKHPAISPREEALTAFDDLFSLMRQMQAYGDNPAPYFDMVANQLIHHLGEEALAFAQLNQLKAAPQHDAESHYIWDQLCQIITQILYTQERRPEKNLDFPVLMTQ
ncbi:MAG: hypothetical protein CMF31_06055 [Kordiimonas sp.]|nr:hypothetical protein [Kordiimonas sp.]|tara:strand:+ start:5372 stop:5734 length:363 start_codon:yes stop_codon:yes gene_type:complete